jgi:hypothetical protein
MSDEFDALCQRLDALSEDLADLALADLGSALRRGEQKRPARERTLTQARRAVEKAAHLLRSIDNDVESHFD